MASKILFATDFSESARLAQVYTEYLALATNASVVVLHITEHPASVEPGLTEREVHARLDALHKTMEERGVPVSITRSRGKPGDQILSAARQLDADIIAMGMQGETHVPYGLIGVTAQTVTTNGPCPVLTVPLPGKEASPCAFTGPDAVRMQRILAPVDFSDPSLDSLECAIHFAHCLKADLCLTHVLESAHGDWDLHRMQGAAHIRDQWESRLANLAGVVKSVGLSAVSEVRTGVPADSILAGALQHRCDLIVMGTHGRRGRGTNVGSVAEAVLRQATCPVLTVKTHKFTPGVRAALQAVLSQNPEPVGKENGGFTRSSTP